jgi:Tol biopolymer transport system component
MLLSADFAVAQAPEEWHASAWQLWKIDVDGTGLMPLDTTPDCRCGSPDWSPDGSQIAYDVLDDTGGGYQTAVIQADGSNRRIVTRGSIPTWSPDGKLIACQSGGIRIVNADGSGPEVLPGSAHSLRWSPDGNSIVAGIGNRFLVFDLATGKQDMLFVSRSMISHGFGISPDGRRYCFGSPRAGLHVAELDEQLKLVAIRPIVATGTAYHASWAPDGRRAVFAWRPKAGDLTQIYIVDDDGNNPPRLVPGIDVTHQNVNPDWSPDGNSIVFSSPAPLSTPP